MSEKNLANLQPQIVWNIFEKITQVPRPSKKEEKIREWIKNWAKENKIPCKEDEIGNILLSQKATAGKEKLPLLIIQGHTDMVCQKNQDSKVDCEKDSLDIRTNGEIVYAEGTSLGADNGIGVAIGLAALIEENLEHGPLDVLLTVDEETGLTGALKLKKGFLRGNYLLNIDSETLGEITISSAGGGDTNLTFPVETISVKGWKGVRLTISGLQGGHSGIDIDKPRLNAIKVGVDALNMVHEYLEKKQDSNVKMLITSITGGSVRNAIPRDFNCDILVPKSQHGMVMKVLNHWKSLSNPTLKELEPKIKIDFEKLNEERAINAKQSANILSLLLELNHGVISYSQEIEGLVQTSNNLAVVKTLDDKVEIDVSTRSSIDEELNQEREKARSLGISFGAKVSLSEAYPGWKPDLESPFLKLVKENYEEVWKSEVVLKAIHAGLECGFFLKLNPNLNVSSIGPTIKNAHSPDEYVNVESVKILWEVVQKIVSSIEEIA